MKLSLKSPVIATALGVVVSVGLGIGLSWRVLSAAIARAAAVAPPTKENDELKRKGWDFWTIEIENLSNELKDERSRMRKQAELLDQRAARLSSEEKEFGKLRTDLEAMRRQIAERISEIAADEAKNIRTLATTYTSLTPRAAVAIFREMDDATAVKILSLMKADVVAPIFEEMSRSGGTEAPLARRAALLSEKLRLVRSTKPANPS